MFLVDTNVVSEMRKLLSTRADKNVEAWSFTVKPADLFISVVTLQELEQGVLGMERRDMPQGKILRSWFENSVLGVYHGRILPVTIAVARACAKLNVPNRRGLGDALIAATAVVHGLSIVTRNVAHFEGVGIEIINPWSPAS